MLKIQEIRELVKLIDQSSIEEFKFEHNGSKVTIKKQGKKSKQEVELEAKEIVLAQVEPQVRQVETAAPVETANTVSLKEEKTDNNLVAGRSEYYPVTSPMVGTFYAAPSPESPAYVKVGDKVSEESIVCIVEAMKLMNEIEAEVKGEIVEILVENGQLVEFGQELFLVKPE